MKKRKIMLLLPFTALILGGCSFQDVKNWVGSNIYFPVKNWVEDLFDPDGKKEEKKEEESAKLESIAISGDFKQEYELGEEFDKTGIIVTASYSNGSSRDVSSEASFEGFSSEAKGTVVVTVSFEGKTAELPLNIVKSHWTASEQALFDQYLYGVALPFIDGDGFSLTYSNGWVYGSGCSLTGEELLAYEALFSEAAGYVDITDEYEDATDGSFKAFRGTASTQQGTRYFDVIMYTYTGSAYSVGGSFVLQAADTYEYLFPDTEALFAKYPLLTPFAIPTMELPDGGYFYVSEGSNNALYYNYEYYTYMTLTVWGYNADQATFDAFLAKFSAWNVTQTSGAYEAKLSVDASHYALVNFSYNSSTKIIKYNITLGLYEVQLWPTANAASIVESLVPGSSTVIPALDGAEGYSVYGTHEIDVDGPSSLLTDYAKILTDALWTPDTIAENTYISPAQDISISLTYSSSWEQLWIEINKYTAPSAEWPTDDVKALFTDEVSDVLPPFEGEADSFQVFTEYGTGVLVFVGEGNEADAIESYVGTLTTALFTPVENDDDRNIFRSPNDEFTVEVLEGTDGAIEINVSNVKGFLRKYITELYAGVGVTFTAPDFSSIENLVYFTNSNYIYFDGDVTAELSTILKGAGFNVPDAPTSTTYGYECTNSEAGVEFDFIYKSASDYTLLMLWTL